MPVEHPGGIAKKCYVILCSIPQIVLRNMQGVQVAT